MTRTAFLTSEKKTDLPILVVDKNGNIGEALAQELKNESLVIYVSKTPPKILGNIVHVPFLRKIPTIPDNQYSHIFVIDEKAELTEELIEEFLKKAMKDDSLLNLIIGLNPSTRKFINSHVNIYDKARIIVFGEIFKKNIIYDNSTNINKYLLQAEDIKKRILISGDGTKKIYPVFFDDLIQGILEAAFGADEKLRIIYLYPEYGMTLLSLANILRKKDPELKIDFVKESIKKEIDILPAVDGEYLLGDAYDLEERIKKVEYKEALGNNLSEAKQEGDNYDPEKEKIYGFKTLITLLVFLILLPLFSTLSFSLIGAGSLFVAKGNIDKSNFSASKNFASIATGSFVLAQSSAIVLTEEAGIVGQANMLSGLVNNINSGEEISISALSLIDASDKFKFVLTGGSISPGADFSNAIVELKNALYLYNKEEQKGIVPLNISKELSDSIKIVSSTIDLWQNILGFNGSKTYLILFQNNMELRPGGGFIGSYAILNVNKGHIASFNIYDVYDADGQLKGHIEPPYPVRRYLSTMHWFLRDSNFNVDFSKGAISSALFLDTEMHQSVDGVIGVDLSFVKNILSVLGPVRVADYNQVVTADNFYKITQAHTQKGFFPSSTQKKDFLSTFYNSLELKISGLRNIPYLSLIQAVTRSIYEKHIIFAYNNANEQATFSVNGWSSALVDERPVGDAIINDFIGVDEANMGGDKVNYYVTRNMTQKANIDDKGEVSEDLTLKINNSAPINSGIEGIYKNYLRFILPINANLLSVQINGKEQKIIPAITDPAIYEKKGFVAPDGLEVQRDNQGPNTIYGFLVNVGPQTTMSVEIGYALAQQISLSQPEINYNLKTFKQPGVDSYNYNYSLNFPSNFKVLNSSIDVKTNGNTASLSTQITRDREVQLNLVAK